MPMSSIERLRREIAYNREVLKVLQEREMEALMIHSKNGRIIEAKTLAPGLVLMFSTSPLPDNKVLLVVKPNKGLPGIVEEIDARLLTQRVHASIRKMFGEK